MNNPIIAFDAEACVYDTDLARGEGTPQQANPTLWIGAAGDVDIITAAGSPITFKAVQPGTHLTIRVSQVKSSSAVAAADIVCMY